VSLTQVYVLLKVTGHYHCGLVQYLRELEIPVYLMHVQKCQAGILKSDRRDALGPAIPSMPSAVWSRRPPQQRIRRG
jgi:transposase